MITFRLVCALAVLTEMVASATIAMTVTVNGMILFRPMVMIDPLVLMRLLMVCSWFPLLTFRRQDTCGTNGAYSSLVGVSQEKTVDSELESLCQSGSRQVTSIADVIIRGCLWDVEERGHLVLCC